jgi:hypothetical protein
MTSPEKSADYFPFKDGRFRLSMGLTPLPAQQWLPPDDALASDIAAKPALLTTRHSDVFQALPESEAASAELIRMLAVHLPHHHATHYRAHDDGIGNLATGEDWDFAESRMHPLDLAGRLVQADLCLMQLIGGHYCLVGASLCSPARWLLAEKIGQSLDAIHASVPGYGPTLSRPVGHFFQALKPDLIVGRANWGISDDPTAFQPMAGPAKSDLDGVNAGERLWLRIERQTLRRLPETQAILFTIQTKITRLDQAIRSSDEARDFAAVLRDMPDDTKRYKHITAMGPSLLEWLDRRCTG